MLVCFMISFDENGKWKEIEFQCFSIYDYDKIYYMYYIDTKGKKDQSINILSVHNFRLQFIRSEQCSHKVNA